MQKFATSGPVTVVLDIPGGAVRLVASERSDTTVAVQPTAASKKRDVKAAEQTRVEYSDGVLRVISAEPLRILGDTGSLDVTIELPAGSRVQGRAGAAELHASGRLGDVDFDGGYRTVELAEASSVRLQVHTGDVRVGRLAGPARIVNGKGDITIAEAVAGSVELSTGYGDLQVAAARGVSATLDASTSHGRIANALANAAGAGAPLNIRATTSRGDVTARSL